MFKPASPKEWGHEWSCPVYRVTGRTYQTAGRFAVSVVFDDWSSTKSPDTMIKDMCLGLDREIRRFGGMNMIIICVQEPSAIRTEHGLKFTAAFLIESAA